MQEQINRALATRLNFRKWWTQDSSFQLRVAVREADLAFIIRDRTGTDYSFGERSNGMKYFLSYFVQYLAHDAPEQGTEVLLMDEPDAFLSSQGQRDLLRVFEALAFPDDGTKPCPVVYVTHSPFLMDKNHAERIRVLEKGNGDEGTRVVRDAARNHYEPLRSAFGGFVAETSFIGTCNVMLEGQSDQVLLAGMSRRLQRAGSTSAEFLDLNETTLVPAGGASQIPYLAYLARGRDVEKPAVVVLLDGDEAGVSARRAIRKGGAYRKALVHDDYVLLLTDDSLSLNSDRSTGPIEIEDLVPAELAVAAARRYLDEFLGCELQGVDLRSVNCDDGVLSGINDALRGVVEDFTELDKVGFARHVITAANDPESGVSQTSLERLDGNFKELFRVLGLLCRRAVNDEAAIRTSDRLQRAIDTFLQDHPKSAQKNHVTMLFEELDHSLDQTRESEEARAEMRRIADVHSLSVNPGTPIEDLDTLLADLSGLASLSRHRSQE